MQSLPLQVLIVLFAVSPLHIVIGTSTPAESSADCAIVPHHATYPISVFGSSFSTCTKTIGPPCVAKNLPAAI